MMPMTAPTLTELYEADETAWLDAMAELIRAKRFDEFDCDHLAEYLSDMAARERREVQSRLIVLLAHWIKWTYQPERRSRSWQVTIVEQQQELDIHLGRGVLRQFAETVLADVYVKAVRRAAIETGLGESTFPEDCPFTFDQLLTANPMS